MFRVSPAVAPQGLEHTNAQAIAASASHLGRLENGQHEQDQHATNTRINLPRWPNAEQGLESFNRLQLHSELRNLLCYSCVSEQPLLSIWPSWQVNMVFRECGW